MTLYNIMEKEKKYVNNKIKENNKEDIDDNKTYEKNNRYGKKEDKLKSKNA